MWKTAFKKLEVIWSAGAGHITWNVLKAVFHKFYLVHTWILCHKCLSVYINIIVTLFLIYNSIILFSYKTSVQLSIHSLFSCPKKSFSSQQNHFSLMWIIHILVCLLFIFTSDCQETEANKCNQIEVLLLRDFRLKDLTKYCIQA